MAAWNQNCTQKLSYRNGNKSCASVDPEYSTEHPDTVLGFCGLVLLLQVPN